MLTVGCRCPSPGQVAGSWLDLSLRLGSGVPVVNSFLWGRFLHTQLSHPEGFETIVQLRAHPLAAHCVLGPLPGPGELQGARSLGSAAVRDGRGLGESGHPMGRALGSPRVTQARRASCGC